MGDFLTSFVLIFVAEIADKSRLVGLMLTTVFSSRWRVFWGMTLAYAVLDGPAVIAGATMSRYFNSPWLVMGAGALFIIFGAASFFVSDDAEERAIHWLDRRRHLGPFLVSFLAIALSEMGDRTQITFAALTARTGKGALIFAGGMIALAALNAITVLIGKALAARLKISTVRKAGGAAFIVVGIMTVLSAIQ